MMKPRTLSEWCQMIKLQHIQNHIVSLDVPQKRQGRTKEAIRKNLNLTSSIGFEHIGLALQSADYMKLEEMRSCG